MSSSVWAVFRPTHGYEESEAVFFVCLTKAQADHCAARMNGYLRRLSDRLPRVPNDVDAPGFDDAYEKRERMLAKARWPFGIDLRWDLDIAYSNVVQVQRFLVRSPRV